MSFLTYLAQQLHKRRKFAVQLLSIIVGAHGLFIFATTLLEQFAARRSAHLSILFVDLPLLVGLSLLYLSTLLRRFKHRAWQVTIAAYLLYLGVNLLQVLHGEALGQLEELEVVRAVMLPLVILALLLILRREFVVRSDLRGFQTAAQISGLMLSAALLYGVAGFMLFGQSGFHQKMNFGDALHYTVDQFDLTTKRPLHPYNRKARVFADSLSFISISGAAYVVVSLFQPLRLRLTDQTSNRQKLQQLLETHGAPSEDFFKLWPEDKQYFFGQDDQSALAFHVYRGVALCLGDPVGRKPQFEQLMDSFSALCYGNDWLPALIHTEDKHRELYTKHGFAMQKIGEEAVVGIEHFEAEVVRNKYFRHINNKFTKQGFTAELLTPPHHQAVLDRLQAISADWLSEGGRTERGFVMGYYSDAYMQLCPLFVVRDAAGTIQAFLNQIPAGFDAQEATFDLLRHTTKSMGNINDFLLINFMATLKEHGYQRLNLGLCPLVGLEDDTDEKARLIDGVLRFAYVNGDRFYSFSGLHRFKAKYEPEWRDRYITYQGGVRGFSRTMTALVRTMRVKS